MTEPPVITWIYYTQLDPESSEIHVYGYTAWSSGLIPFVSDTLTNKFSLDLSCAPTLSQAVRATFRHRLFNRSVNFEEIELHLQCAHVWEHAL